MKIKDQIRSRREALGMSMKELGDRVGVTEQAVRHWESGRSFPGKSKALLVQQALSCQLDWTEGAGGVSEAKTAAAMIDQGDIELLLVIAKLPAKAKNLIGDFARIHLEAVETARRSAPAPAPETSPPSRATKTAAAKAPALAGGKR